MKILLSQINPTVGDIEGNYSVICDIWDANNDADMIVFPEMCISGYSAQDLILRKDFVAECEIACEKLVTKSLSMNAAIVVGSPASYYGMVCNCAFVIYNGVVEHVHRKNRLPNYGVFDEQRIFLADNKISTFYFKGSKIAILICEDAWYKKSFEEISDVEFIIVINASPFSVTKHDVRKANLMQNCIKPIIYVNQVGVNDSILYDGGSMVIFPNITDVIQLPFFKTANMMVDTESFIELKDVQYSKNGEELLYSALVFALSDYLRKNFFTKVIIGISGGIDSALTAAIAIDSIGKENVILVALPSKYSSEETYSDVLEFAIINDINVTEMSIQPLCDIAINTLHNAGMNIHGSVAEENIQSRMRGILLMAMSNADGAMLLSTGNKSEMAVGYATLYGDMNGGYNLLKDVYKTDVYKLAKWRNSHFCNDFHGVNGRVISDNIITKAPTAELKYDQKDQDTLPEYEVLDQILKMYIDHLKSVEDIVKLGYDAITVGYVLDKVRSAQFKRNQSTLGPKVSEMSFDLDWRYPVVNYWLMRR